MDNNESGNNSYTPQTPVMPPPNTEPLVPRARRTKPMVEGINAPVRSVASPKPMAEPLPAPVSETTLGSSVVPPKVTLTSPEKELIEDPVIPPATPFVKVRDFDLPQRKKISWNRIIWAILISLLAVSLVLGVLFWYDSRSGQGQSQFFGLFPQKVDVENGGITQTTPALVDNLSPETATSAPVGIPLATTPTSTTTISSTTPETSVVTQVKISATPTNFLNVRSGPSLTSKIVTKVHPGDLYTYTTVTAGWYQIILKDGTTGWIFGQYVQVIK